MKSKNAEQNINLLLKNVIVIMLIFFFSSKVSSQQKVYRLLDKTPHANMSRHLLNAIDTAKPRFGLIDNAFKPKKGRFTVYRFIATYDGMSFTDKIKEFHDIVIVKTNKRNKIVDAYQYTIEWADAPFVDLYESTCHGKYLKDKMPVEDFIFKRRWYYDKTDQMLKDTAIIEFE